MYVKKYFEKVLSLDREIISKQRELERLRELSTSIGGQDMTRDRVQTSKRSDKTGDLATRIVDLQNGLDADIEQYIKLKGDIKKIVDLVETDEYRIVLQERYGACRKFTDIATDLDYSLRHVYRLHRAGLRIIKAL